MRGLCFSQKVLTSCAGSSKRERTGAHQNGPGGAGSGEERKMQRRESLLRAPVYEEVCLARGRLEMRLGRFFYYLEFVSVNILTSLIIFSHPKKKITLMNNSALL